MKNKVIQGDCLEVMKDIPDKSIDLVFTDPPFGITKDDWDKVPEKEYFDEMFRISKEQLFFGGQFFDLPKKEGWLIWFRKPYWLKKQFTQSKKGLNEADLIWISKNIKTKVIEYHISGNIEGFRGESLKPNYKKEKNSFTSQKPVRLCKYIIEMYFPEAKTVIDPFAGSGTTGLACKELGINFTLIEKRPEYIDIINKRLAPCPVQQGIIRRRE